MHEYKHGELTSGGAGKVKNPKQAVAIALHEAGASKYESPKENHENLRHTKSKERHGETGQAWTEGSRTASEGRTHRSADRSKVELYEQARRRNIRGHSMMSKDELARALRS
jgi:Family of unknown function (DUF6496)